MTPKIVLVVAIAENGVIGKDNRLPWKLPGDLKRFQRITMGKPLVMGRFTFESMGGPLKGRTNIVVTHNRDYQAPGAIVAHSLDEALAIAAQDAAIEKSGEIAVIGGSVIFAECLARAEKLEITEVHGKPEGDTVFPPYDRTQWKEVARDGPHQGEKDTLPYSFVTYERR